LIFVIPAFRRMNFKRSLNHVTPGKPNSPCGPSCLPRAVFDRGWPPHNRETPTTTAIDGSSTDLLTFTPCRSQTGVQDRQGTRKCSLQKGCEPSA